MSKHYSIRPNSRKKVNLVAFNSHCRLRALRSSRRSLTVSKDAIIGWHTNSSGNGAINMPRFVKTIRLNVKCFWRICCCQINFSLSIMRILFMDFVLNCNFIISTINRAHSNPAVSSFNTKLVLSIVGNNCCSRSCTQPFSIARPSAIHHFNLFKTIRKSISMRMIFNNMASLIKNHIL